jgi:hypothetical protein
MGVTVTDRRTIFNEADSLTNWNVGTLNTSEYAESTASVAYAYNIATGQIYWSDGGTTTLDLTDQMIYIYSACNALQNSWTTGPHALFLGDGTNQVAFHMAGGDRDVFKHADGPVLWQSFVLDGPEASGIYTDGEYTNVAGNLINLNFAAIEEFGGHYITQSKALGGGQNCFCDIIRYGNDGIRVTGGSGTGPGTFLEVVLEDRSTDNQKAHGIIRELSTDVYGIQGPITFGWDNGTTEDSWFDDDGIVIVYENRRIGDNRYYFNVVGSGAQITNFTLIGSTIKSAGPKVKCDFSSSGIDSFILTSVVFTALGNEIYFANDIDASGHFITQCTFDTCGIIDPGTVNFNNNTIQNAVNPSGGLLIDDDDTDSLSDLSFISGPSGHAIYVSVSGSYQLTNFTYTGYGATGTTDASVFNNSSGIVILNINGGDSPTYRNGVGSTTFIKNSVDLTITVVDTNNNKINNASVYIEDSNNNELMNEYTNAQGVATETYNYVGDEDILIRIRKSSTGATRYYPIRTTGKIESTGFTLTAVMSEDNIVS